MKGKIKKLKRNNDEGKKKERQANEVKKKK